MNNNRQNCMKIEKIILNSKQLKAIPNIIESNSIEEAAQKTRVSRGTLYNWLKQDYFSYRLNKERKALFEDGLNKLKSATSKAAQTLISLLDSKDKNIKRLAAKEIINFSIKSNEIFELEERVSSLEEIIRNKNIK